MPPRYLMDTDMLIYLRSKRSERVERRVLALAPGEAAMSVITFGELWFGVKKSSNSMAALERLQALTRFFSVLPLPDHAAEVYGAVRTELERTGRPIGSNDLWIAAHAKAESLTLVTNNVREFRRIANLRLENWTS